MAARLSINVILRSDRNVLFEGIVPGQAYSGQSDGVKVCVEAGQPAPVTVTPPGADDPVKSVEYNLYTDSRNYHKVIVPDTGRRYMGMTSLSSFPYFEEDSAVREFRMPIYLLTGQNLNMQLAFGIIGTNYETTFRTIEPTHNRALIAYMRRLSMQIRRGTDLYPIPDSIAGKNPDGSITEHLYYRESKEGFDEPWILTLRDFAEHMKRIYDLPDVTTEGSMEPLWCSWTDWMSDDVTDEVILANVREGVKLGIGNYIIDDGWFGPGLDTDYSVELNIGDWEPDPAKIKDMGKLVRDIRAAGGTPMIWCAPHAVAAGADCFEQRKKYLIVKEDGELLMTPNVFHTLCFMCPEAREIMADVSASLIERWDFDGAKYDLFNCVPTMRCCSTEHTHDVTSMMEGLDLTLKLMADKTRAIKPDYIIELKQNYGTPFLSQYGTMTRAGDTPYSPEVNFLRTMYVQAYSPYAINDYQTITSEDSPEAAACIVLKMIAAGIPTYSIDFSRLSQENKDVIARYNKWYSENIRTFMKYRVPLSGENSVLKIADEGGDVFFLVNEGGAVEIDKSSTILNATFKKDLFVNCGGAKSGKVTVFDCFGKEVEGGKKEFDGWAHVDMLPGGMVRIEL